MPALASRGAARPLLSQSSPAAASSIDVAAPPRGLLPAARKDGVAYSEVPGNDRQALLNYLVERPPRATAAGGLDALLDQWGHYAPVGDEVDPNLLASAVRDVAPLACKTDKVDARVLAELCRRDLVPELWVPSLDDRALRERLRRRAHLVKIRTSARNRIFGLLTQWGLRISLRRLREPEAMELLCRRGVPAVWRRSIAELSGANRRSRAANRPDRRRARAPGPRGSAGEAARHDPGGRSAPQPDDRRRDRRGLALSLPRQARRLLGAGAASQPVG